MCEIASIPRPFFIQSLKGTHFTGAIAQNAMEVESFPLNGFNSGMIESIILQTTEALSFDVYFWATGGHDNTDLDLEVPLGKITFASSDFKRIGGANQYRAMSSNVAQPWGPFPYFDKDARDDKVANAPKLFVGLVCTAAAGKSSGAGGAVALGVGIRPDFSIAN